MMDSFHSPRLSTFCPPGSNSQCRVTTPPLSSSTGALIAQTVAILMNPALLMADCAFMAADHNIPRLFNAMMSSDRAEWETSSPHTGFSLPGGGILSTKLA